LPCCQRCTGLYAGAGVAALLHLWLRPKLSSRFLELHGAFLLAMVPFGFHWVAQGPALRTLVGALFGFGVVAFLRLPLRRGAGERPRCSSSWGYWLGLMGTLIILPLAAGRGGVAAAYLLSGLIACGMLALGSLVLAVVGGALRWLRRLPDRRLAA